MKRVAHIAVLAALAMAYAPLADAARQRECGDCRGTLRIRAAAAAV